MSYFLSGLDPIVEYNKAFFPSDVILNGFQMGLEIFLKDRAKEMIFPVTLGEGEKDTNTEHAGAIASTCTKRRHEQGSFFTAGCPVDLKSHPLRVYHTQEIKEFEMSCKLDLKKNKKRCL